jgi:hypothetical protein
MKTIQIRCKAFAGGKVEINKIQVDDAGVVRVWDSVAGHYTTCHSLTPRSIGKIARCMGENNMLRPISYCPPALQNV